MSKRIAIFASGTGTNARNLINYFKEEPDIEVSLLVCNKEGAKVLDVAGNAGVSTVMIDREGFYETEAIKDVLQQDNIDMIVLAGFLWLIPTYLIDAFPNKILNIHPALLPKYGGKGMYGMKVHQAVKDAGDEETGISVHLVNEKYDDGALVFQTRCPVSESDSLEDIAKKVHELEMEHYPATVRDFLQKNES